MPIHHLHSDGGQAIALFALIIGGALIALSVITDLHVAHQVTMYLRDLGRIAQ